MSDRGQATVELVASLPAVLLAAAVALQLAAAGAVRELAGSAAEAGAIALIQGQDATRAAREAVPGWTRTHVAISTRRGTVTVTLTPVAIVPGIAGLLRARETATAGAGA